jgi:proteasome lid subunit RPN8/RPN11
VIRWIDNREERRARSFTDFGREVGAAPAVQLLAHALAKPLVLMREGAADEMLSHLRSSGEEMGGLLIGQAYALPMTPAHGFGYLLSVEAHVPSERFDNSPVSLRMGTELWQRAAPLLNVGSSVLGWYHSHPNLGAFFSGTDRDTQRSFFRHPYSIGLVIDPVRGEHACFAGPDSEDPGLSVLVAPSVAPLDSLLACR